jgi:hypothetical protein
VFVPPEVVTELQDLTQYHDIHGAAVTNVLAARAAKPMGSFLRTHVMSTASLPTSSVGRTSRLSTRCYRDRGSNRHRDSSVNTPGTAI